MKFSQVPANSRTPAEYVMIGKAGNTFRHEEILSFYKTDAIGSLSSYVTNPNKSAIINNKRMKSVVSIITILFLFATIHGASQRVGINKTNPTEALDVNGNINLNGTIKANGIQGSAGQVLTSTGAGVVWNNMSNEFKNVRQIYTTGTTPQVYNFIVPAGVTRVMVELWGGGGGGSNGGGGAGGNYRAAIFSNVPGALISITAGVAGQGIIHGEGGRVPTNGGNSSVSVNGTVLTAVGGGAALIPLPGVSVRQALVTPPANISTYYLPGTSGDAGAPLALYFPTSNVTEPYELYQAGNGGYSYSFNNMGGSGGIFYFFLRANPVRFSQYKKAQDAQGFGCGGGGTRSYTSSTSTISPTEGGNGSPGMVMLRW
jgi:hypothetical protein